VLRKQKRSIVFYLIRRKLFGEERVADEVAKELT
jgi:hypothetical protein